MDENNKRIDILYRKHHDWLIRCAINLTKDNYISEELVQNLYIYLLEKGNEKIYYLDSFNLKYCYMFLKTRHINMINKKKLDINNNIDTNFLDIIDDDYDFDEDKKIDDKYIEVKKTIDNLKKTNKIWCPARIFEMYINDEHTILSLSKKLKLSKSTVFINIDKIKKHLRENIDNPNLKK